MKSMHINEVKKIKDAKIIDVREPHEYANGTVKGAKNIPMTGLMMNPNEFLEKDEPYYIMCQSGGRSHQVCDVLEGHGYDVTNLEGGYNDYNDDLKDGDPY